MKAHSHRSGSLRAARIMYKPFITLACLLAAAAAAPAKYDQSQNGSHNNQAEIKNVVIVVALPSKLPISPDVLMGLLALKKDVREAQDRSDVQSMEAFVEPSTPYRVEIGPEGSDRSVEGDGRAVEVVIATRRRSDGEPQPDGDEFKLLGAIEQCGPEGERDPVTLTCRLRSVVPEIAPQVEPASS